MSVEVDARIRLTCSLAQEIMANGKTVDMVFREACPFGKTAMDAACIHCKQVEEEVVEDG